MRSLISFFVLIICFSCKKEKQSIPVVENKKEVIEAADSTTLYKESQSNKKDVLGDNSPIHEFIVLTNRLELGRWKHDTIRAKKIYGLGENSSKKPVFFKEKPFYELTFDETGISRFVKSKNFKDELEDFDVEVFENTVSIWSYFYRDDMDDNWIEDGIIEQWEFKTQTLAKIAHENIEKKGGTVFYFNTNPFFYTYKNYLFIFHTRAMAFSYDQKIIFEDFKNLLKE
ncbi:hypothetical protein [uncultured Winogradskyella sp.]|uniref:hypothetical protein n=1 Tax=uncultured Winogradskyella sp. TaxID=395353 RepID=UPI002609681E|nr:hypothetical protein [uncultured Winogradskyella sp.]